MKLKPYLVLTYLLVCCDVFAAEIILQDGTRHQGTIVKQDFIEQTLTFKTESGTLLIFPFDKVMSVHADHAENQEETTSAVRRRFNIEPTTPYTYEVSLANSSVNYFLEPDNSNWVSLEGVSLQFHHLIQDHLRLGYGAYWGNTITGHRSSEEYSLEDQTDIRYLFTRGLNLELLYATTPNSPGFSGAVGLGGYFESTTQRRIDRNNIQDRITGYYAKVGVGYQFERLGVTYSYDVRTGQASGFEQGSSQFNLGLSLRFN